MALVFCAGRRRGIMGDAGFLNAGKPVLPHIVRSRHNVQNRKILPEEIPA
jgi:hypothetical protein